MFEDNQELEAGQAAANAILEGAENAAPEKSADELAAEAQLASVIGEETEGQASPGDAKAEPITDPVQSLAGLFGMIGFAFRFSGLKRVSAVWSNDSNNHALASATIPVLAKYAWGQRVIGMLSGDVPVQELALLMAAAPFAVGTVGAFRADMAEKRGEPLPEVGEHVPLWERIFGRGKS